MNNFVKLSLEYNPPKGWGFTRELAKRTGLSEEYISRCKYNDMNPRESTKKRITEALTDMMGKEVDESIFSN